MYCADFSNCEHVLEELREASESFGEFELRGFFSWYVNFFVDFFFGKW